MLSASDLKGFMAMMPAFATDDAVDLGATNTVHVERLHAGVDRMVRDGADVMTTTGSFGECHSLLLDEYRLVVRETLAAVDGRIPVVVGVPSENAREAVQKIAIAQELGAQAVIVAIPYYIPSTAENAVRFLTNVAARFPRMGILIYHNPPIHRVALPVEAFHELVKSPNIIGMKDSHRDPLAFLELDRIIHGKISHFVSSWQYFDYAERGAAGFWSIDAWMGPEPLVALRDAVRRGDRALAEQVTLDIQVPAGVGVDLKWRETAWKIGIQFAGYVEPGPLRAPFDILPDDVIDGQKRHAARWRGLCEKYAKTAATA